MIKRLLRQSLNLQDPFLQGISWGYIGIMEKKMETTVGHRGYIGIMTEKRMLAANEQEGRLLWYAPSILFYQQSQKRTHTLSVEQTLNPKP